MYERLKKEIEKGSLEVASQSLRGIIASIILLELNGSFLLIELGT